MKKKLPAAKVKADPAAERAKKDRAAAEKYAEVAYKKGRDWHLHPKFAKDRLKKAGLALADLTPHVVKLGDHLLDDRLRKWADECNADGGLKVVVNGYPADTPKKEADPSTTTKSNSKDTSAPTSSTPKTTNASSADRVSKPTRPSGAGGTDSLGYRIGTGAAKINSVLSRDVWKTAKKIEAESKCGRAASGHLSALKAKGLIEMKDKDGKKFYRLTKKGAK